MLSSVKLDASRTAINPSTIHNLHQNKNNHQPSIIHLPQPSLLRFASLSSSAPSTSSSSSQHFTSTVGSPHPHLSQSNLLTPRYITLLNVVACSVAISTTWLFCSAIPTLLAFKRAAESLEKLLDVTREELPDTMAAMRLSGMEISDLTMELSDLGQEITQGVRSSTRAVRGAEERLRRFTNMSPSASLQEAVMPKAEPAGPVVARSARNLREGIVKSRSLLQLLLTVARYSRMGLNFFVSRAKR